jgi:transcriptional regulator GlxA family with amidase domain
MKVGIIAYENCTASMIIGLMDILALANSQSSAKKDLLFEMTILTRTGEPVNSFTKYPMIPSASIRSGKVFDIIYVPGFLADPTDTIDKEKEILSWLAAQYKSGTRLVAACNGNLFLAEAGVLNGKTATTHWSLKDFFQKRYPLVRLKPEMIIIDEGDIVSAAGVTAYMNLAIHLVAKHGSMEMASSCSKIFLVDSGRRVQTPYLIFSTPKNHGDKEIVKVQEWIEDNYQSQLSVDSLMNESALSRRTLVRRFKSATGDTPVEYLQRVRIEKAKRFLETTNKTFSEITWDVGYTDISSFQRLFKVHTRLTPREYRSKFSMVLSN